jgi:AcrR family transcriptional regulator
MGKRGPKRDPEVQQRILDATRELIAVDGPNKVTIDQITAHAGVGRQTIYRWWPTRTALVIDSLEQAVRAESPTPDAGSARLNLRTQMRRVARLLASPIGSIIQELIANGQGDPVAAEQFRERFFNERRKRAAATITDGIQSGELRSNLDIETVIDMLYSPLWLRMLIGHQPLTQAAADRVLDHCWPALVAEQ